MIVLYTLFMDTSIAKIHKVGKKTGRPVSTGAGLIAPLAVRLPPALVGEIENWRRRQPQIPSRNEAIRRLLELALRPSTSAQEKKR